MSLHLHPIIKKKIILIMKKLIIPVFAVLMALPNLVNAQKFGYVDTDYILEKMPEYNSAQKQINDLSATWQKEIDALYAEIDKMYKDYIAEDPLLTPVQKKSREQAIVDKENEAKKIQQQRFGVEGDLFKKRQELIKPIQDKVYEAVKKVAKDNALDFIFDKAGGIVMLYTNVKYDKSDEVLDELGVVLKDEK